MRAELFGVGRVVGQAVGGDDLPRALLDDQLAFPGDVCPAGGGGGEESPAAEFREIARPAEAARKRPGPIASLCPSAYGVGVEMPSAALERDGRE